MKDSEKNSCFQERFFEQVRNSIPLNYALVDFIADKLEISNDAAYRRIRGDKLLDFEEISFLCKICNISFDAVANLNSNSIIFQYNQLDFNDINVYLNYIKGLSKNINSLRNAHEKKIYFTAVDIPIFHFLNYKELTFFKIFTWSNSTSNIKCSFNSFLEKIETPEIMLSYQNILNDYIHIPSVEIWTYNTIDSILRLIDFYYETGYFEDPRMSLLLCEQLVDLIKNLEKWSENQSKSIGDPNASFKLYVSDIDLENSFMYMERDGIKSCMLKLFTINSMVSYNENFCNETSKWIDISITRSILISGASEKEKYRFFQNSKQKVYALIDKITKTSTPAAHMVGIVKN